MHKIPTPPYRAPLQGGDLHPIPLLGGVPKGRGGYPWRGGPPRGGSSTLQNPKCVYPEFVRET